MTRAPEPCPRRIRGVLGGRTVVDTTRALYVWEHDHYPQYRIPAADVVAGGTVEDLEPGATVTACPYKGTTSGYWAVGGVDVARAYDSPTAALLPIAGLVGFYGERLDVTVDGTPVA